MTERVTGFILLTVGILIILFSAFGVYNVFSGRQKPFPLFNMPGISIDASSIVGSDLPPGASSSLKPGGSKIELVQAQVLNDSSNILAYLFFMGFVASIGYKIGALGAMLARPVVVKLKTPNGELVSEDSSEREGSSKK